MRGLLIAVALMVPSLALSESRAAKEEQRKRILHAVDNCSLERLELVEGKEVALPLVCAAIPKQPKEKGCLLSAVSTMLNLADRNRLGFTHLKNSNGCEPSLYASLVADKSDEVATLAMNLLWRGWKSPLSETLPALKANLKRKYPLARFAAARTLLFADVDERRRSNAAKPAPAAVEVLADLVMIDPESPDMKRYDLDASLNQDAAEELLKAERVPARVFPRLVEKKMFFENCERLEVLSGAARRSVPTNQEILGSIDWKAKLFQCDFSLSPLARLEHPPASVLPSGYTGSGSHIIDDFQLLLGCNKGKCSRVFLLKSSGSNFYGEAFFEIADSLDLTSILGKAEAVQLDYDRCRRAGRMESGLFAIARNEPGPVLKRIRQAWTVDKLAGKIVPSGVDEVVCSTECPGMACPW